jgi:hypothetical protein
LPEALALFAIWDRSRRGAADALPIVAAAILTARLPLRSKIEHFFRFFDMDDNGRLSRDEMSSAVRAVIVALCALTGTDWPNAKELERWTRVIFRESDALISADNAVTLHELWLFVVQTPACIDLFTRWNCPDAVRPILRSSLLLLLLLCRPFAHIWTDDPLCFCSGDISGPSH